MSDDDLFEKRDSSAREVFTRYNREDRIKNASEKVKQLHDPDFVRRRSFIKSVTENRGLRSVFFVIVVLAAINIVLFVTRTDKNKGKIYGVKTELKSFIYQNRILVNLRLSENLNFFKNSGDSQEKDGALVRVNFIFLDDAGSRLSSSLQTGIYTGSELIFSSQTESSDTKKVQAEIYIKEKLLVLSTRIK
ncbi:MULTISPECIES: hypothetical protein [unclassified Treponema]|uniref:hypothetical protein n=1 Tax=unclassified Treponema TaxID=2638727 RepID=UPI0020A447A2|nr:MULTISPECIES: hypothetical protein [unclassified Treponema]UTC67367.1 hypothetical protein E4O06_01470 [Treponema sp. OMZ 789]UTC70095.1 hypothetical protein E4O01_01465 [Treponema sp. OMZ 790]UTC72811.1 hypothetical protein E4O02_01465 [Treponema sp. OMZ 791]